MNRELKIILITILTLSFSVKVFSQKTEILKDCKIISIDTNSILPDYFIITTLTEKGRIILLSYRDRNDIRTENKEIRINRNYDFEILELDSIPIYKPDTICFFEFTNFRGGNGNLRLYQDNQFIFEFKDFNYKPFKPINLKGLEYTEIQE